ncbi:hypothetical protein [Rhizorhabdus dicambivorans]|uniref:hypothetical protein n=1 Tax=Rhizorhabdus dicambivorans TaxID=1850238 RepID=UPI0022AA5EDF|nr:hypothetical protein [Rhizorhabdus dicambivorans]
MRTLFLAVPLLALPTPALAGPLRFEEALARAEAQAPSLRAKGLEVDARRSALPAQGSSPIPSSGSVSTISPYRARQLGASSKTA